MPRYNLPVCKALSERRYTPYFGAYRLSAAGTGRQCLPEIAPQGHFLALRAQGATSAFGLLAMTIWGLLLFYRQPVPVVRAAPGAACRSPTKACAIGDCATKPAVSMVFPARKGHAASVFHKKVRKITIFTLRILPSCGIFSFCGQKIFWATPHNCSFDLRRIFFADPSV